MKKRRRKVKVGPVEVGVDTLKNGGIVLAGFGVAEYAANKIGEQVTQLSTTMAKAATKGVLATITGVAAFKSKTMKAEGLLLATGMGASAIKDVAVANLPGEILAYLPVTNEVPATPDLRIQGIRLPANATPRYPYGNVVNPGQYANGGVRVAA